MTQAHSEVNKMFGGRRNRRKVYRHWLKLNGVPKPVFAKISERRSFNALNYLTFLDDVRKSVQPATNEGTQL